jgi:hypothetical protein
MTIHIRNLEWADHNTERSFPLTIDATKQDTSGTFTLPDEFLVDIRLAVGVGVNWDPSKFFIKSIGNYQTGFGIVIGYDDGSFAGVTVATANIARGAYSQYQYYALTGVGDFVDATGFVQLGKLDAIDAQPGGQFTFDIDGGNIEGDCLQPQIRAVQSFTIANGNDVSDKIYGDIEFVARRNMRITTAAVGGTTQIIFDAIDGEGLSEDCVCDSDDAEPIRFINDVPGTPDGKFFLIGNDCLEIEPIANGLRMKDVCSEPCCGCEELEIVTNQLEQFGRQATTLENFISTLQVQVTQMDRSLLGSRLNDRGCTTCE